MIYAAYGWLLLAVIAESSNAIYGFVFTVTVGRTLPLLLSLIEFQLFRVMYGYSGVLAILALCCLGINLSATVRRMKVS